MRTVPRQETLKIEFKSDLKPLPDRELIVTVVCLANTEGGILYLGVEDDGTITGLHPNHQRTETLAAFIGSDALTVKVVLSCTQADIPFYKMIVEEEARTGRSIPLDALIILSLLRQERRIDVAAAAQAIQKNDSVARSVLERLVEAGLVEPRGATRART